MSQLKLIEHRKTWKKKPVLRRLYTNWYQNITSQLIEGRTLELGGGSGNLKEFAPDVMCTDIVNVPWLDAQVDAQNLPFRDNSLSNIVLFDVLHHIENPCLFFQEANRTLREKGRIIIMDPYNSLMSWPVYHFLHPEPVNFRQNPLALIERSKDRVPFDANQAITQLTFGKNYSQFKEMFPALKLIQKRYLSFWVYPLSGGFEKKSLIPDRLADILIRLEDKIEFLGWLMAFRIFVVLEKTE